MLLQLRNKKRIIKQFIRNKIPIIGGVLAVLMFLAATTFIYINSNFLPQNKTLNKLIYKLPLHNNIVPVQITSDSSTDNNSATVHVRVDQVQKPDNLPAYHLSLSQAEFDLNLNNLNQKPEKLNIAVKKPNAIDGNKIKTNIFYLDQKDLSFDTAQINLKRLNNDDINTIVTCSDGNFNPATAECKNGWRIAQVKYVDNLVSGKIEFETGHFSAYAAAYMNILNLQADLTGGDVWEVRFLTAGTSTLVIEAVDGTDYPSDLIFQSIACGDTVIDLGRIQMDGNKISVENYQCDGQVSNIKNKTVTSGRHWLTFTFGDTIGVRAHNFACDSGTVNDTCTVSTAQTMLVNGDTITGSGTLVIASGGSITNSVATNHFNIIMDGDVTIQSGGTITGNASITAANLNVNSGGSINVNGKGYAAGLGTGAGRFTGTYGGGGGYGGYGGYSSVSTTNGGITYGSPISPTDLGSGGAGSGGGSGGGAIKIAVTGTTTIGGTISANGNASGNNYGGGSGGSIWIDTNILDGSGTITANGEMSPVNNLGGSGGGGRIAITYNSIFSGTLTKQAVSGLYGYQLGGAGTIYTKDKDGQVNGDLLIDNSTRNGASTTPVGISEIFDTITLQNYAKYFLPAGYSLEAATALTGNTTGTIFTNNGTLIISGTTISNIGTIANNGTTTASNLTTLSGITTFTNNASTLDFPNLTTITNVGLTNSSGKTINFSTTSPASITSTSGTKNFVNYGTVNFSSATTTFSKTATLGVTNYGTINCSTSSAFIFTPSTFTNATGSTFYLPASSTISSITTLTNSGTISAASTSVVNFFGITTYTNSGTTTLASTQTINGVTTFNNSGVLNGTTNLTLTGTTTFNHSGTMPDLVNLTIGGSGAPTFSYNKNTNWSFANLTINSGGVLTHGTNTTAKIYVIDFSLSGDLTINSGGSINVNGKGFRNDSGPGAGNTIYSFFNYYGSGAGHGGNGGNRNDGVAGGITNGTTTAPINLGSGGGGDAGGGSGGGAIKIAVTGTSTINGAIYANGNNGSGSFPYNGGGGAGGSIWLDTNVLAGTGSTTVNGGTGPASGGAGGGGRIAITYNSISSGSIAKTAYGGASGYQKGGAGTIYTKDKISQTNGDLLINNLTYDGASTTQINANFTYDTVTIQNYGKYVIPSGYSLEVTTALTGNTTGSSLLNNGSLIITGATTSNIAAIINNGTTTLLSTYNLKDISAFTNFGIINGVSNLTISGLLAFYQNGQLPNLTDLTIGDGSATTTFEFQNLSTSTAFNLNNLTIKNKGVLTHKTNTTTALYFLNLNISNDFDLQSGGYINVNNKGYSGGIQSHYVGYGPGAGGSNDGYDAGGGGHGGNGGNGSRGSGGTTYDSTFEPTELGSGGGAGYSGMAGTRPGGAGGGVLKIVVVGTSTINGIISANGESGTGNDYGASGGGSGGSVFITTDTLNGSGSITVNGGNGYGGSGRGSGGGGGGRIAIKYNSITSGSITKNSYGGAIGYQKGGAGSVYIKNNSDPINVNGDLFIDNSTYNGASTTQTESLLSIDRLILGSNAKYVIATSSVLTLANIATSSYSTSQLINNGMFNMASGTSFTGIGTFSNSGSVTMENITNLSGITMFNNYSSGIINISTTSPIIFSGVALNNYGLISLPNTTSLTVNFTGGLTNATSSTFTINNNAAVTISGSINNNSTFNLSNNTIFSGCNSIINSGLFNLASTSSLTLNNVTIFTNMAGGIISTTTNFIMSGVSTSTNSGVFNLPLNYSILTGATAFINNGALYTAANLTIATTTFYQNGQLPNLTDLTIGNGFASTTFEFQNLSTSTAFNINNLIIKNKGTLTHTTNTTTATYFLNLNISGDLDIQTGALIDVSYRGFSGGNLIHNDGYGPGAGGGGNIGAGGGYGGNGGNAWTKVGGSFYGSSFIPIDLGSGAGSGYSGSNGSSAGGAGGGGIRLNVSGTTTINGFISANGNIGQNGNYGGGAGGGSGGSVQITTNTVNGTGIVMANGGSGGRGYNCGASCDGAGGGGGRIALGYKFSNFSGTLSVSGGTGIENGGIGTIKMLPLYGEVISSVYNSDANENLIGSIRWTASTSAGATVKFQIRTSADNISWSPWAGPDNGEAGLASDTYFTHANGTDTVDADMRDGAGDKYFQYKAILESDSMLYTPELFDVSVNYVVNAYPEFEIAPTASQNSGGTIDIAYSIRDSDTLSASTQIGYVMPSYEYSINNGNSWQTITSGLSTGATSSKAVDQVNWTTYNIVWDPHSMIDNIYSTTTKIRVTINDGELANSTVASSTIAFQVDTKDPLAGAVPLIVYGSSTPAALAISATDDSAFSMKIGLLPDLSDGTWVAYASTSSISLPATATTTVYVQFQDEWSNLNGIIFQATTPETPSNVVAQDISNVIVDPPEYRLFFAWKIISDPISAPFDYYSIQRSLDNITYTEIAQVSPKTNNYYADFTVASNTPYYYRVAAIDQNDNSSQFSVPVSANPNGYQDAEENNGTPVSDVTPPVITNVATSSVFANQVTVSWDTDELSDSRVDYSTNNDGLFAGAPFIGLNSMVNNDAGVGHHEIVVSGLTPDTDYYFIVNSKDLAGNNATSTPGGPGYTFHTSPGPVISDVYTESVGNDRAVITWHTNEVSNSYVFYSLNADLSGASQIGADDSVTSHSVTITGLTMGTRYYYYVQSGVAHDKNTVSGVNRYYDFLTTNDATAPTITFNPATDIANITSSSAHISWTTDELATSSIDYGTSTSYGFTLENNNQNTNHLFYLDNLATNTTYYIRLKSTDENNNIRTADNGGLGYTFNTIIDITPPVISNIIANLITDTAAVISWDTNEGATSLINYGIAPGTYINSTSTASLNIKHAITITGLAPNTRYYYQITSADASANMATSTEYDFTTLEEQVGESEAEARENAARQPQTGGGGVLIIDKTDKIAPVISDINLLHIGTSTAKISWLTDEDSDGFVAYDKNNTLSLSIGLRATSTEHIVDLTSLEPNTTYYYRVTSADAWGNVGQSEIKTFATLFEPDEATLEELEAMASSTTEEDKKDNENILILAAKKAIALIKEMASKVSLNTLENTVLDQYTSIEQLASTLPAPMLSGEPKVMPTAEKAVIIWHTDKAANSLVSFSTEARFKETGNKYVQTSGDAYARTNDHLVTLEGLQPDTVYHYQVKSKGQIGPMSQSSDFIFRTDKKSLEIETYTIDNISNEKAVFKWITNVEADSSLKYIPYRNNVLAVDESKTKYDKAVSLSHEIAIEDFEAGTIYSIELSGKDTNGNQTNKIIQSFTTNDVDLPPTIYQVRSDSAMASGKKDTIQTIITWMTNELSTSRVYWAKGMSSDQQMTEASPPDKNVTKKHAVIITKFEPGAIYRFMVESVDSNNSTSTSKIYTILTPRREVSVFDVIKKNFIDVFGWTSQMGR